MRRQIAKLSPPPAGTDQGGQQSPGAKVLQQFIHPLGERVGNYRLIFVHDLSVPERRRAQVLSLMKMRRDTSERTRSHALAASHVSMVENAGKGRKYDCSDSHWVHRTMVDEPTHIEDTDPPERRIRMVK
ncbi:hypothetical protein [Rhizobium sp. 'Codium 1']|uniref:hypothetical protein n=1 Tax=Rhizobium sp. 'Codium 1' TaxID=2940484 RepID=UPI001E477B0F|nr:hypothetical protein [Rhizobium sp. 'Codium 1']MCC8933557.1 hypothetical protein [Rhizobium sp. 'Codium 1']